MLSALEKAGILVEALPYIEKFHGKTVVIKYGGHAMLNADLKNAVMQDVILMRYVGINPVLVHGGGPEISDWLARFGKESCFVRGLRVTDAATMEVVEMVLGKLNKDIVTMLHQFGGRAVGLSGKDGFLLEAAPRRVEDAGNPIDLGYVGEVSRVNPGILATVMARGYVPVVAPIGAGPGGASYNINADEVAAALAVALKADKLVLLTDVEGVFADYPDPASLLSTVCVSQVPALIAGGAIQGGMIPKVECCVRALQAGVQRTHIIDGRIPHSILLEVFTNEGIGTMVLPD